MPMAMRLPSPTLSMISRGPKTQSPPAKTPGALVIKRPAVGDDQTARRNIDAVLRPSENRAAALGRSPE